MENNTICSTKTVKKQKKLNKKPQHTTHPFVMFEQIPGDNMQKMLSNNTITFPQYIGIFIQVLLALEIGQKNICFTHHDFHTGNLMCRTINKDCSYNVPVDNFLYEVTAKEYLPVIIDFGLSSVKHDGVTVGSYTFPEHGMTHYMIPGADMYKFLFYSAVYSEGSLQRQIINLFSFYGTDDPYKVCLLGDKALKATKQYVRKGSFSSAANYTPLEFLNWILENPEYSDIASPYMKKKPRNIYTPISFSSTIKTYDEIFNKEKDGRKQAIHLIQDCITTSPSYIMSKYYLLILEGYNNQLQSVELTHLINLITTDISNFGNSMIKEDYKTIKLHSYLDLPNMKTIKVLSNKILNIKINSKRLIDNFNPILKLIEQYYSHISFFNDILPYLQFMYTIKEIKAENIFSKFLSSFISSPQYITYTNNCILISRTSRWCQTLLDVIN